MTLYESKVKEWFDTGLQGEAKFMATVYDIRDIHPEIYERPLYGKTRQHLDFIIGLAMRDNPGLRVLDIYSLQEDFNSQIETKQKLLY